MDLGYLSWHPLDGLTLTAGKMRQPFVRPGSSAFIDNEIRPEGVAVTYKTHNGVFGSAFRFWLEERSAAADSMLNGLQTGWEHRWDGLQLKVGAGYYDYSHIQGRYPGFGNGVVNELGNTIIGSGSNATYAHDYDIGQLFAEVGTELAGLPLSVFADYARNTAVDHGLDRAYNVGVVVGKANRPGRWEIGAMTQQVEKDALFGQWIDSDFAGGVADNEGQVYRLSWMTLEHVLVNFTYYDTLYNVDVGSRTRFDHWQLDVNLTF